MEQRDPPRISKTEGLPREPTMESPSSLRFPRLLPDPVIRHGSPMRVIRLALAILVCLILLYFLLARLRSGWVAYVHSQPSYQTTYREIILDPPPPPWFRGGSTTFLDHILGSSGELRSFSILDLNLESLRKTFLREPWVKQVIRVEAKAPKQLIVRLVYRQPVAYVGLNPGSADAIVDADAVLLPQTDIDLNLAPPLIRLHGFPPPANPRLGEAWNREDPQHGLAPDPSVAAAASLAAFLTVSLPPDAKINPAWNYVVIHPRDAGGFFLQIGNNLMFRWELAPTDAPARPTTPERWKVLQNWVDQHPPKTSREPEYYELTPQGVVPIKARNEPDHAAPPGPGS